jgi:hypothetical protein
MRTRVSALGVLGALVLVVSAAGSALAAGPTRQSVPTADFDDPYICGADPVIHVSYTAGFRLVTWTDSSGAVIRDAIFAPGSRVVLTDDSTGRSLSGISPAVFRTTYAADGSVEQLTVTGLNAAIAIPGEGMVLLDTGSLTWAGGFLGPTLAEHGPHAWFGTDAHETFCAWYRS